MPPSRPEAEPSKGAEGETHEAPRAHGPFGRAEKKSTPRRRRVSFGDVMLGAAGVALGLTCAFFPWYIFFNQEQFGIRALEFEGVVASAPSAGIAPTYSATPPLSVSEIPVMELDLFSTGTLAREDDDEMPGETLLRQPFPGDEIPFRVIHASNGRAMIADDAGIWVVQRGSKLPDSSQVAAIEQRDGRWVVVTDDARVLEPEG